MPGANEPQAHLHIRVLSQTAYEMGRYINLEQREEAGSGVGPGRRSRSTRGPSPDSDRSGRSSWPSSA
ncbi:protein of unknown function [Candidatus Methylomirabilis oxygeniifera]|uniref:Uncharacterized protein n=1 Tax=Methylomirabilis oxygeniifera TaxID=671143 RepID=D5MK91_METO1|nr:protein of unknown function [Candidatus Methylomirabilis oxyfera]